MTQRMLYALITHVKVALLAIMELISLLHAEVAFSLLLKSCQFERVLEVASVKSNRATLETKELLILLFAVHAPELDNFFLVAAPTLHIVILLTFDVQHDMVGLTFFDN